VAKEFPDDLFDSGPLRLVDDAEGGVWYRPGFVDADTAARWFSALRGEVAWQAQRRPMNDRVVDVPRLTAAYWLDRPDVPAPLLEAAALLRRELGEPFNAVGLNLYRDRDDSVAPHGDKLHMLVPGHPVALLSLGAARRMVIRAKPPAREVHRLELAPGSLLVMSHASQRTHEHGVPKLREAVGERISLAFRVRPPPR